MYIVRSMDYLTCKITDNAPLIPLDQREKVREFVEELVSTLVGGPIDNAPVGQLFENKECKSFIDVEC